MRKLRLSRYPATHCELVREGDARQGHIIMPNITPTPKPASVSDYLRQKNAPCGGGHVTVIFQLIGLLRLRLHMVRDDEPVAVNFLVDIGDEVVELGRITILHFLFAGFLTHFPREVAVDVNMLV